MPSCVIWFYRTVSCFGFYSGVILLIKLNPIGLFSGLSNEVIHSYRSRGCKTAGVWVFLPAPIAPRFSKFWMLVLLVYVSKFSVTYNFNLQHFCSPLIYKDVKYLLYKGQLDLLNHFSGIQSLLKLLQFLTVLIYWVNVSESSWLQKIASFHMKNNNV